MKIVLVGAVEFSKKALEKLVELKADVAGVVTQKKAGFNSDFFDLTGICRKCGIPCICVEDINSSGSVIWLKRMKPDIIFCFGFSQILSREVLSVAPKGVVGYHPAMLPENRGRHPIVWALVLGLKKTASTFFFMKDGIDNGDILDQVTLNIDYKDDARSLYNKLTKTALRQIENFLPKLQKNTFKRVSQGGMNTNYWRRRTEKDGEIDFKMSGKAIYNLTRGLTRPYAGAHITYKGKKVRVWRTMEVSCALDNYEYGRVLKVKDRQVLVKCGDNAVLLMEHEFGKLPKKGEYLI